MKFKNVGELLRSITMAVLFLVILLLVVFSARSYQHSVDVQSDNDNLRAVLSYVITASNADRADNVSIRSRDGITYLSIEDVSAGTEQCIYFLDGKVLEYNGMKNTKIYPEDSVEIGLANRFEMKQISDGFIRIDTDLGDTYIHTHS